MANVINHRGPYRREVGGSGSGRRCGEVEGGSLKMEKGSRTQGIQWPQKLKKAGKQILPQSLQKELTL